MIKNGNGDQVRTCVEGIPIRNLNYFGSVINLYGYLMIQKLAKYAFHIYQIRHDIFGK